MVWFVYLVSVSGVSKTRARDVSLLPRLLVNQLGFEEKTGKDASGDEE